MKKHYCVLTLLLSTLLTSCVLKPDLGDVNQPKTLENYETKDSFKGPTKNWPTDQWWQLYNDPQFNECITEGLKNSPSILQAEARLAKASGYAEQAGARLYPSTSLNASYTKQKQSYNFGIPEAFVPKGFQDNVFASFNFSYELDFWGRNRALIAAACSEEKAAFLDLSHTRIILASAIAEAYAELVRLYANFDAAQAALVVRTKTAELFLNRFKNGLENEGGYEQALAAKEIAEGEIEAVLEAIALTKGKISALMGAGPDRAFKIKKPQVAYLSSYGIPENLPAELLGRRPDIMAARHRLEALEKNIEAAEGNFYPNINLSAMVGLQSLGLSAFTKSGSKIGSVGPALNLPLFNGGAIRGQYQVARAEYDEVLAQYHSLLIQALNDVANVLTSQSKLAIRLKKTENAVAASQKAYDVINARYKGGLTNYLEVLRAEDMLITNRRTLADIRSRSFILDVALVRALGGGFVSLPNLKELKS